jgi:hypothetical protein
MTGMALDHPFAREITGLGNPAIIPNFNLDGRFNITFFAEEGFPSLIAVPILTYKVEGILGAAYKVRRQFTKDYADLLIAIAGMVGMAYNKCLFLKGTVVTEDVRNIEEDSKTNDDGRTPISIEPNEPENITNIQLQPGTRTFKRDEAHEKHIHRMGVFRESHRKVKN